jgi:hypothetical protein
MLYKSCRWTYKETNKIGFAFLWFSMNLYDFSNLWPKHTKEGRIQLQRSPWKVLDLHRNALGPKTLTTMPSVAKRARRRWGGAGDGQQLAPRFNSSRPTSIGSGGTARDVAGERRRRSNGGTAATTGNLVRFGVERVNVPWFDAVSEWSGEFIGSGNGRCGGARCSREEGRATTFYRRERDGEAVRKSSHSMAMVWARHGARPQYGHDMAPGSGGVRAGGRPMARGGAAGQRVRARHVAPPGVHERHAHEREARRTNRRSQACLDMWYDDVWQRPTWRGATTSCVRSQQKQFDVARFDQGFLPKLNLKCTKR